CGSAGAAARRGRACQPLWPARDRTSASGSTRPERGAELGDTHKIAIVRQSLADVRLAPESADGCPTLSRMLSSLPFATWRADLFEEAGTMTRKLIAEFIGTFMLVTSVCGAALFSVPSAGLMTVAFAIGTAVLAMAYAVGSISGGHFNPAVTCGLAAAGRFSAAEVIPYIIAQVIGGIVAAAIFYFILSGAPTGKWNDFIAISNIQGGEGPSPLAQVALIEIVLTALFLIVIVSVTWPKAPVGFAPIAIGLTLTFIPLVAIPVDNAWVTRARSPATAIFGGGVA